MRVPTVLCADESASVRALVREQLGARSFDVVEAATGAALLEIVERLQPDVILLGTDLPDMQTNDALVALRSRATVAHVPVLLLTAHPTIDSVLAGHASGGHDFVRKPVDPADLVARVFSAMRMKSVADELRLRNAELDVVSRTDVLTGLYNRRHLEEALRQLTSQARRYAQPFTVVMFDIDRFRDVNETHGRTGGDDVLRTVARRIQTSVRESDVCGRWGGEQFLALLPMTELAGARTFAERIRASIDWAEVVIDGAGTAHVTVSAGIAEGTNVGELLLRADEALYAAKKAGRNAVRNA
ncbi:MAG: diguanylate cyclase [Mycobacteriales bacterium]